MEDKEKDEKYKWSEYGDYDRREAIHLEGKDVLAIAIAALQTIFLPLFILIAFLVILSTLLVMIF
ncbi:hypothetical protein E4H12_00160 [Candidatus Thorarchaeota archaeon]|nr:MAG: hypothetical protein E4H12_00160 [Candidatus Thorarchaeota archaeon]